MKRVLANLIVACFVTVAVGGCSTAVSSDLAERRQRRHRVPRGATNWPGPSTTPPSVHKPYPIVLAHGFSGFHNIGPLTYFYGVQDALSKDGHQVFVTRVDPYNSSEARGAELLAQVQSILGDTSSDEGQPHLPLAGRARLSLRRQQDRQADRRRRHGRRRQSRRLRRRRGVGRDSRADGGRGAAAVDAVRRRRARSGRQSQHRRAGGDRAAHDGRLRRVQRQVSRRSERRLFLDRRPQRERQRRRSIAARRARRRSSRSGIRRRGRSNALLSGTASLIDGSSSPPPTNDGLVTVASAKWGTFLGCVPADHLSEVCQIGGQSSGVELRLRDDVPRHRVDGSCAARILR